MSDPEISSTDFSEDKLANRTENSDAPAWFECPRWGGQAQPITPRRQRAIADKRAFDRFRKTTPLKRLMAGEEFVIRSQVGGDLFAFVAWFEIARSMLPSVAFATSAAARELLCLFLAAMRRGGYLGVAATHDELALVTHRSARQTRRIVANLVDLELVAMTPLFVRYGAASSQRGNAYVVAPALYAAVDTAAIAAKRGQPNGCPSPARRNGQPSGYTPECLRISGLEREALEQNGWPLRGKVEPEHFSAAVPDAAAGESGPVARQGESCSTGPEAPDRASHDEFRAQFARYLTGGAS